jgi:hypothetical protein
VDFVDRLQSKRPGGAVSFDRRREVGHRSGFRVGVKEISNWRDRGLYPSARVAAEGAGNPDRGVGAIGVVG